VMFCDLVGSTALASRLDPEDLWSCFGKMESTLIAQEDLHAPHTLYERVSG
jgi:hypothetical protein